MESLKLFFDEKKKEENLKIINKLNLKERKQQVIKELETEDINIEKLNFLMLMDNTNEDLLYKYIQSFDKFMVFKIIQKYSSYMSLSKFKDLLFKIFGKINFLGYRDFSYKNLFFQLIYSIKDGNKSIMNKKILIMKNNEEISALNNQPFDLENLEVFYFHLCDLLMNQIEKQIKVDFNEYLNCLKDYISSISSTLEEYKNEGYKEEQKDIKKFLIIFFSIINFDVENSIPISQVSAILEKLSDEERRQMISVEERQIKTFFGLKAVVEFKKILEDKEIYDSLNNINNISFFKNKIEIPEECYSYEYIIKKNIFKKYENQIKDLLKIIYKSDLFNQLVRIIYKTEDKDTKYFFDENNFVEDFWNNNIIFVPFKLKKISGFSYKDTFLFFFPIYKIKNFGSEVEDEIFTLGAFVRVLIHETFGHLMISYIFYMFYANTNESYNYLTRRMKNQLKELNRINLYEFIGNILAKLLLDNLYNAIKTDSMNLSEIEKLKKDNSFTNKLYEEFSQIIGKEYTEKLIKKLKENPEIIISKNDKKNNLSELSKIIIEILINLISDEFDKYINDLKYKQEKYKEFESGNFVEFLLFNNFDQYMTLKECLYLLNEEIYQNINFIRFRSEFKSLVGKKNDDLLKELTNGHKIFGDLFNKYNSIYEKKKNISNDLITQQNFRGSFDNNLNKKFEAFECFNFKRSRFDSGKKND